MQVGLIYNFVKLLKKVSDFFVHETEEVYIGVCGRVHSLVLNQVVLEPGLKLVPLSNNGQLQGT